MIKIQNNWPLKKCIKHVELLIDVEREESCTQKDPVLHDLSNARWDFLEELHLHLRNYEFSLKVERAVKANRSAKTGKFVNSKVAAANPDTTVRETIKKKK